MNGCELLKCKYYNNGKCTSPHDTCIYQTPDALDGQAALEERDTLIVELQAEKKAIKAQYAKDLVAINKFYYREPICQNQPPEITNGYDACLSCPMRKTCLLIFKTKP